MARSRWKLAYFSKTIWRLMFKIKLKAIKTNKLNPIYIYSRKSTIPNCFKGYHVNVHKGKNYRQLFVELLHSSYKFGEYSYTRKLYYYPLKKKKRR